ncbi:MAG: hypothetical protein ETSY1_36715 [Candidatus Entotheonella factor]|uniref:Uncharacterized protein n=1 Tax=Entotheonella factor TaxID=1429438 RepID=W4L7J0_ENTF1|nr:MAG: hypothetical protein ETSY1_36715 [Candidatus Entotheonella factor]
MGLSLIFHKFSSYLVYDYDFSKYIKEVITFKSYIYLELFQLITFITIYLNIKTFMKFICKISVKYLQNSFIFFESVL